MSKIFIPEEMREQARRTFIPILNWNESRKIYVPVVIDLISLEYFFNSRLQAQLPFSEEFFMNQDHEKDNLDLILELFKRRHLKDLQEDAEGTENNFLGTYKLEFDDGSYESLVNFENQKSIFNDFINGKGIFSE